MILRTERLVLRTLGPQHAALVQDYLWRNEAFFKPWLPAYSERYFHLDFIEHWMAEHREAQRQGKLLHWFLFHESDEAMRCVLGDITYSEIQRGVAQTCHLGYKIDRLIQSQGFVTEALKASNRWMFEEWKLHRIEACIMPSNAASRRVVEKLGFTYEGIATKLLKINGQWEDHCRYALVHEGEE